jgi:hypothetical protein
LVAETDLYGLERSKFPYESYICSMVVDLERGLAFGAL